MGEGGGGCVISGAMKSSEVLAHDLKGTCATPMLALFMTSNTARLPDTNWQQAHNYISPG